MHFKILLSLFLISTSCFGQDTLEISRIDTLLPFFGKRPLRLHGYENRDVPYESKKPLYVLTTYKESKNKHFEYFRIDSSKYLVYEFFRSDKGSSNEGMKSKGNVEIINKVMDSSTTRAIGRTKSTRQIHYYKGFSKEGTWFEFEDSLFYHRFWTGNYISNKKVGIWKDYIYDPNEDKLITEIDFDTDSSIKLYSINVAETLKIDSINSLLLGRWSISCEDDKDRRMFINRCPLYDGQFAGDCNGMLGKESYYEFLGNSKFKRQNGETCDKFKQNSISGNWQYIRKVGKSFLEITLNNKAKIIYQVLYLDREGNMIADRL